MNWDGRTDRRNHRRAAIRIRSEFGDPGSQSWIETVDFSAGGFSCWMNHAVAPLTKLALTFEFPPFGGDSGKGIACEAIVVRSERRREPAQTWMVAAAFTGLKSEDRDYIERYVDWHEMVVRPDVEEALETSEDVPGAPLG